MSLVLLGGSLSTRRIGGKRRSDVLHPGRGSRTGNRVPALSLCGVGSSFVALCSSASTCKQTCCVCASLLVFLHILPCVGVKPYELSSVKADLTYIVSVDAYGRAKPSSGRLGKPDVDYESSN